MVQVVVNQSDMIERLKTDPQAREQFLTNTHKLLSDMGVNMSHQEIKDKLEDQLRVKPGEEIKVASTNTVINVMAIA